MGNFYSNLKMEVIFMYTCVHIVLTIGTANSLKMSLHSLCETGNLECEAEIKTQALFIPTIRKHPI